MLAVCRLHHHHLETIPDQQERLNRIIELNTIEQCMNVFKIGLVQRHQVKYGFPRIHGLVYNIHNGELKELDVDFQEYVRKYRAIYRLHSFPSEVPLRRSQLQGNMIRTLATGHEEEPGHVSVKYIRRAMTNEPLLFSATEIDAALSGLQDEAGGSKTTVDVEELVRYFED